MFRLALSLPRNLASRTALLPTFYRGSVFANSEGRGGTERLYSGTKARKDGAMEDEYGDMT